MAGEPLGQKPFAIPRHRRRGERDHRNHCVVFADLVQQQHATAAGDVDVEQHRVELHRVQLRAPVADSRRAQHVVAAQHEQLEHEPPAPQVVFDNKDPCHQPTGILTVKVVPTPSSLSTSIVPPCISTSRLVSASPKPVPPGRSPDGSVSCSNERYSRDRSAGAIPIPVSITAIDTRSSSRRARTRTIPPRSVNFTAFEIRLYRICRSRTRSARTLGTATIVAGSSITPRAFASGTIAAIPSSIAS